MSQDKARSFALWCTLTALAILNISCSPSGDIGSGQGSGSTNSGAQPRSQTESQVPGNGQNPVGPNNPADMPVRAAGQIAYYLDSEGWAASPANWQTIQYADLNGDGKADVCGRGSQGVYCALMGDSGFGSRTQWSAYYIDLHGWASTESYWQTIRLIDLNGDKRSDICGRASDGLYCALSTGEVFTAFARWSADFGDNTGWRVGPQYWATIQYGDVNGDGQSDVCGRGVAGLYCALSSGSVFSPVTLWTSEFSDALGWRDNESYWRTIKTC